MGDLVRPSTSLIGRKQTVYFIVDASDTTIGDTIGEINKNISSTISKLKNQVDSHPYSELYIRVMRYGTNAKWISDLTSIEEFVWEDLEAGGEANLGKAFELLTMENPWPYQRCYPPVVVLVSSTIPTDKYEAELRKLNETKWFKNAVKKIYITNLEFVDPKIYRDFSEDIDKALIHPTDFNKTVISCVFSEKDLSVDAKRDEFDPAKINLGDIRINGIIIPDSKLSKLDNSENRQSDERPNMSFNHVRESTRPLEELMKELDSMRKDESKYTEKNHPGREKCDKLREIRKKIAEANGIEFEPAECHHTGPCMGTCPTCDKEIQFLDDKLQEKKKAGDEIKLVGIADDDLSEAGIEVDSDPTHIIELGDMGDDGDLIDPPDDEILMGDIVDYEGDEDYDDDDDDDDDDSSEGDSNGYAIMGHWE